MLNAFRLAGDLFHVISIFLLLLRLRVTQNAIGISMKTQEIYLVVFVTRYLDLFTTYYSLYNSVMKILYIASTSYIIYMVRRTEPFKTHYETSHDSFLHWKFAVAPCAIIALITHLVSGEFNAIEVKLIRNMINWWNLKWPSLPFSFLRFFSPHDTNAHMRAHLCPFILAFTFRSSSNPGAWPSSASLGFLYISGVTGDYSPAYYASAL